MTQMHKGFLFIGVFLYAAFLAPKIYAATPDAVNQVLQQGLPAQPAALATLTEALKKEYEARHNVVALVFYAYGLLRQADGYAATNDFIHASEYAKSGFFWLDEAVDLQEKNQRVRYLRARVDAYLPADSGRCVVTVQDTEHMLADPEIWATTIRDHILAMRYRALRHCKDTTRANALLAQIKGQNAALAQSLTQNFNVVPEWDSEELTQVLLPLMKGE
ncbi:hypothetical protein MLP03_12260 [Escherichia coli]|nr:hypothetical protein [Escherichia coli]